MSEQPKPVPIVVIVVEDEVLIRMVLTEALLEDGFDVLEATHAQEAIAILENEAPRVHALFTDVHMPGELDGLGACQSRQRALALAVPFSDLWPCVSQSKRNAQGHSLYF